MTYMKPLYLKTAQLFENVGVQNLTHAQTALKSTDLSILTRQQITLHVIFLTSSPNNSQHASSLHKEYLLLLQNYFGFPLAADFTFNTELVSKVMSGLKCGKAPDINGLTAEHLLIEPTLYCP